MSSASAESSPESLAPATASARTSAGMAAALRNALKLGASQVATWGVAVVVGFFLPAQLGPALYGSYRVAEGLAATAFVFLGLGIDVYIQKEVSLRPEHASDFFGGVVVARALLSLLLFGALALVVASPGVTPGVGRLVALFGLGQVVLTLNASLAALLQAQGTVGTLAVANVASKVLWALSVGAGLWLQAPLPFFAASFLLSEAARSVVLWPHARRELSLRFRVDLAAARQALVHSLPFYVNAVAVALCSRFDIVVLELLTGDEREVGWYGAASNLANVAMLLAPLVGWVVMPLLARARQESEAQFLLVLRRALEGLLTVTLPVMLFIGLAADVVVQLVFREAFAPAALSLRALAPLFGFTYLAMLLSRALVTLERGWTLTLVSFAGVLLGPLLALLLIPWGARTLGTGGAGVGVALANVGAEVGVTALLLAAVGPRALDARTLLQVGKSVAACAGVVALHLGLSPLGPLRLPLDVLAYVVLALALGAVRPREVSTLARLVLGRRRAAA